MDTHKDIIMDSVVKYNHIARTGVCFDGISQVVGPARFIKILNSRREDIEDVRYIPPVLGSDGFGRYKITFCNAQFASEYE